MLMILPIVPFSRGAAAGVIAAAVAVLFFRLRTVGYESVGSEIVIRNRWITHRISVSGVQAVDWAQAGVVGGGPTTVAIVARNRVSPLYPFRRISIDATASYDADWQNYHFKTVRTAVRR